MRSVQQRNRVAEFLTQTQLVGRVPRNPGADDVLDLCWKLLAEVEHSHGEVPAGVWQGLEQGVSAGGDFAQVLRALEELRDRGKEGGGARDMDVDDEE